MAHIVERAMQLWSESVPPGPAGLTAFRTVYADPVAVNGVPTDLVVLVERARMVQGALAGLSHEVLERTDAPDRCAVAFRIAGRHVGPLTTPLGIVAPTQRLVDVLGMDIFVLDGDPGADTTTVVGIWSVADYLGLLMDLDVATLSG